VEVLTDERKAGGRRITLRLLEPERTLPPLAPASLVRLAGSETLLELHRLNDMTPWDVTFETSDDRDLQTEPDDRLGLQSWWTPDALELVTDMGRRWREVPFDDHTMIDYCPLCYRDLREP